MKKILSAIFILSLSISGFGANRLVNSVADYVYPANRPNSAPELQYLPDGESYLKAEGTTIVRYDTKTGNSIETVFDCSNTRENKISYFEGFSISPNGSRLLIWIDSKSVYRRSSTAVYYTYEIAHRILRPLSQNHPRQQTPLFSPDNRQVAFVADNNIYIAKLDYNTEVAVTTDGKTNEIINGMSDWTYEEEFATSCSMAWAPDSETLCFLKYNETDVPMYSLPIYEGACNSKKEYALYPGTFTYKYPVAGERNSIVTLHSYDVSNRKIKDLKFEDSKIEYIPRIMYTNDATKLIVVTLNREQDRMEIYSVNPKSTIIKSILVEQHTAWLAPSTYENLTLTDKSIILQSTRSGYNHLYEYSFAGSLIRQLTDGDYDVTKFYGMDAIGNVYYQSTKNGPLDRVVSKRDTKGKVVDLSAAVGTTSAKFSPTMNYYSLTTSDVSTAPITTLYAANQLTGKQLRVLEDNADYARTFANLPKKEFITINSDGNRLNAYVIKPANFDPSRKYPVIMWQYSGPGSQSVLNSWEVDWDYAAVNEGFIVVCVDGRGTGGRGRAFMDVVYKQLGRYETIDQINAAREISRWSFVDSERIGIAGWSYGGYEALMCATHEDSPFAAVVAIAPVTDWRYYDTVYAERYMLTPRSNETGYFESAPVNFTSRVKCPILLMYGTSDDNVHPANTLEFVSHMEVNGNLCDMLLFPNMNHSIYGCNSRSVVYAKMIDYFKKNM